MAPAGPLDENNFIPPSYRKGDYTDAFGCVWHQEHDGFLGQIVKHPIQSAADLDAYTFPPLLALEDEVQLDNVKQYVAEHRAEGKYFIADFVRTFERMHFMRGMEPLLMDMAYGNREFHALLEKVLEWNLAHIAHVLNELGDLADAIWFSDDWGTQNSLLINPAAWRKTFKPCYEQMFNVARERGKSVFFHSDGFIMDIIGDLREIGCDAINCQIELMGAAKLAEQYGGKITFHTDLDRQNILPFGTPQQIKNHVFNTVENLNKYNGGLILSCEIGPDVPFENITALFVAFDAARG
jgi:uroporphyrinogen decarboxylase